MTHHKKKQSGTPEIGGHQIHVDVRHGPTDGKTDGSPGTVPSAPGNAAGSHHQQGRLPLNRVFEAISDPLILLDENARVTMVNEAARKYYGVEMIDRVILHICFERLGRFRPQCRSCRIPSAVAEGRRMDFEREGFKDPKRMERVELFPIHDASGAPLGAIMRVNDITDAKATQQQIDAIQEQNSIGMLVSSVAHEIKNPNSFITFNIAVLQEYFNDFLPVLDRHADEHPEFKVCNLPYETFRGDVFKLLAAIERGSQRIEAFLAKLREVGGHKEKVDCRRISPAAVIERVLGMVSGKIERMVKQFEVRIAPDMDDIDSDPEIVEQVLVNLLINALQASDKQDAYIGLKAGPHPKDRGRVVITVEDNGHGMAPQTLRRIFEPFYSTKIAGNGSGLGLYVCRKNLNRIGGELDVKSELGQGTCFTITLPARADGCRETDG